MRSAVLANAQNKVTFRVADEDARVLATPGSGLAPEDFAGLDAYQFYAQLVADDAVQSWCSGRSLPPEAAISDPDESAGGLARRTTAETEPRSKPSCGRWSAQPMVVGLTTTSAPVVGLEGAHERLGFLSGRSPGRVASNCPKGQVSRYDAPKLGAGFFSSFSFVILSFLALTAAGGRWRSPVGCKPRLTAGGWEGGRS